MKYQKITVNKETRMISWCSFVANMECNNNFNTTMVWRTHQLSYQIKNWHTNRKW